MKQTPRTNLHRRPKSQRCIVQHYLCRSSGFGNGVIKNLICKSVLRIGWPHISYYHSRLLLLLKRPNSTQNTHIFKDSIIKQELSVKSVKSMAKNMTMIVLINCWNFCSFLQLKLDPKGKVFVPKSFGCIFILFTFRPNVFSKKVTKSLEGLRACEGQSLFLIVSLHSFLKNFSIGIIRVLLSNLNFILHYSTTSMYIYDPSCYYMYVSPSRLWTARR